MRKFITSTFFIFYTTQCFSQKQITNFYYPQSPVYLDYSFFESKNDKNFLWFHSGMGVFILNLNTKQIKKIFLEPEVSANAIISYKSKSDENGSIILKDSVNNYYIAETNNGKLNILRKITEHRQNLTSFVFFHSEDRLLISEGNQILQLKNSKFEPLTNLESPLLIKANENHWTAINRDSLIFDEIKQPVNPKWNSSTPNLMLYKDDFYLTTTNALWKIRKEGNKLFSDTLFTSKSAAIQLVQRDDSLLLQVGGKELYDFYVQKEYVINKDKITFLKENFNRNRYWEWENEVFKIFSGNYSGGIMGWLMDKRKTKNSTYYYYNYRTTNQNNQLKQVQPRDSGYLFSIKNPSNYTNLYVTIQVKEDTLLVNSLEGIKKVNDSLILGYNSLNKQQIEILNLRSLVSNVFLNLPEKKLVYSQPNFLYFEIGEKNLAIGASTPFSTVQFIKNFRTNTNPILFKSSIFNDSTRFFINDEIIPIKKREYHTAIDMKGIKNLFIGLGAINDTLFFYEVGTKLQHTIATHEVSHLKEVWVISKDEMLFTFFNNFIYSWKNGNFILLKNSSISYQIFQDDNGRFWIFEREPKKVRGYIIENQKLIKKFEESYSYFTFLPTYIENNIVKLDFSYKPIKFLKIKDTSFEIVKKFWKGESNTFWSDEGGIIYCLSDNYLYSSTNPFVPENIKPPQTLIIHSKLLVQKPSGWIFYGIHLDKGKILKYVVSEKKYYYLKEPFKYSALWFFENQILFKLFKNDEPYFFLINEDGEFQLNKTPIEGNIDYQKGSFFTYGNIKGKTKQIYEFPLNEAVPVNLEWIPIENQQIEETKQELGEIIIFPNPLSDQVSIKFVDTPIIFSVGIYNSQGKLLWFQSAQEITGYYENYLRESDFLLQQGKLQIYSAVISKALLELSEGTYFVRFNFDENNKEKSIVKKIIKQ